MSLDRLQVADFNNIPRIPFIHLIILSGFTIQQVALADLGGA